jgi:hypothetical protein
MLKSASQMPTISMFYGILIRMFFNDHPPPNFHARYGEFEATFSIETLEIPRRRVAGPRFEPGSGMGDDT